MIFQVYAYRDLITKAFTRPILETSTPDNYVESMTRAFMVEDEEHHVKSKDLTLYRLGTYDDVKAKFDLLEEPECLLVVDDIEWKGALYGNMQKSTQS